MADRMKTPCAYCGTERDFSELESRDIGLVCRDADECRDTEARSHRKYLAELRKCQREGDELSDAEKRELADA